MAFLEGAWERVVAVLETIPQPVIGAVVLAAAVAIALTVHGLAEALLRRVFARRTFMLTLLARTRGPARLALVASVLAAETPLLPLGDALSSLITRTLAFVFILLVGWIALTAVDLAATIYLMRFRIDTPDHLLARKHVTQVNILKRVAATLVTVVTIAAALMTFDAVRQYGVSLFASAGAAGIVVGLAARPLFSNLIAGVQLAISQPIRIDDAVIVENEWGTIEEITSTYVVVKIWDLRRMIVPLTYFIEKPFQNWTREGSQILGAVILHTDFSVPVERVRAELRRIVEASALWDRQVVGLQVTDAGERSMELRALMSAPSAGAAFDLRCEVREKLIAFLQREYPEALPRGRAEVAVKREEVRREGNGRAKAEARADA